MISGFTFDLKQQFQFTIFQLRLILKKDSIVYIFLKINYLI